MGPLDLADHLFGFFLPALAVALPVALGARLALPRASHVGWWTSVWANTAAGALALVAGLVWFGRDGKMATYAALVVAVATSQWLCIRAWRR